MISSATKNQAARKSLFRKYQDKFEINTSLNRAAVSYQSNRNRPFYRWFKYKEGFSAGLVEYVLDRFKINSGHLLDPFAGSGAAILAGSAKGLDCFGIELLPIGAKIIQARLTAAKVDPDKLAAEVQAFCKGDWKNEVDPEHAFRHLRITQGAFPEDYEKQLNQFRTFLSASEVGVSERMLLELACLNVLEEISYTRKDGQYLRWDHRAPRNLKGKRFDKGKIYSFDDAMHRQLNMMLNDIAQPSLFPNDQSTIAGSVELIGASCLNALPTLQSNQFDVVITSPPYCNRYDYTRTYALELAFLGTDEVGLKKLRQEMLSCTVENRSKIESLRTDYAKSGNIELFENAIKSFATQAALQEVLAILDDLGRNGRLNNSNVPRMVRNYFLESSIVIFELARVTKEDARVIMVNDNVQYAGEEVPVDLILSEFAREAGFEVEAIWVLARGKGNSSQQMGTHGRNELRKCAYVWRRK